MSDRELWISPTTRRSRGAVAEVGVFPPTARDRPGVKVADWQGGLFYTFISGCNDAERVPPGAVDQDHNSG